MSEVYYSVTFTLTGESATQMHKAVEGMLHGEFGARLQERMDPFGEKVAQKLEWMYDEELMGPMQLEDYQHDGDQFTLEIMTGGDGEDFIIEFLDLLSLCGAKNLFARLEGDDFAHEFWIEDGELHDRPVTDDE